MHANDKKDLDFAQAGDIVAVVGVKEVFTGDTFCDQISRNFRADYLPRAGN